MERRDKSLWSSMNKLWRSLTLSSTTKKEFYLQHFFQGWRNVVGFLREFCFSVFIFRECRISVEKTRPPPAELFTVFFFAFFFENNLKGRKAVNFSTDVGQIINWDIVSLKGFLIARTLSINVVVDDRRK